MPIRPLSVADRAALEQAVFENVNRMGARFTIRDVRSRRSLSHYFDAWPGESDFGFAMVNAEERIQGVAWVSFFTDNDRGYGFVRSDIPELSVWVDRGLRGRGIGRTLITRIAQEAQSRGILGVSLSVESGNPARRLYERLGFCHPGQGFDTGTLTLMFPTTCGPPL